MLLQACSPTKHLAPNEVFLKSNKIDIPGNIVKQEVLLPYLKQRENKRSLLFFKMRMWQHLAFNDSTLEVKNNKKRAKIDAKNLRRLAKGKDSLDFKPVVTYRIKESGEPPVLFDSVLAHETTVQFEKALFNHGYFHNKVSTSFKFNRDSSKVKVIYQTIEGDLYHFNKIALVINDPGIIPAVKEANASSVLHQGDPYNTEKIDEERIRFTAEMRNQGYYYFSKEYLVYEMDSMNSKNHVDIKIIINNPDPVGPDTNTTTSHVRYKVGEITLNTSFNPKFVDDPLDSIHFENLTFINLSRLKYNPHSFTNKLFYEEGDFYSEKKESRTYTRLSGLNNFKYINIGFTKNNTDTTILDCNILMTPFPSQSIGVELEGTNSSGNLGISGYLSYLHRNTFRNAEEFKVRFKGGLEAQQTNTASEGNNPDGLNIFNTVEYGVETSLTFQDLILPAGIKAKILRKFNRPKTSLNFILNYQNRPDFERFLTNTSLGYVFTNIKVNTNEFFIYPIDVSFIRINQSPDFSARLEELNNPLLDATYANQFIAGTRTIETWTNKTKSQQKHFTINRVQLETAGNMLYLVDNALNSTPVVDSTDSNREYYTVGKVRYAQFVKIQNDIHYNTKLNRTQSMAYRFLGGLGVPYGNTQSLPYDRSFYGGGANDMRGWQARSLGPGGLLDDTLKVGVDQVADIKIQLSVEYRFNIFRAIEGAVFADAGNIWLLREDKARELANFDINRFYKEIALSAGAGVRFNFGFLLVRLDWGMKVFDPALPLGQRFVFKNGDYLKNYGSHTGGRQYQYSVFNLGIGYPF